MQCVSTMTFVRRVRGSKKGEVATESIPPGTPYEIDDEKGEEQIARGLAKRVGSAPAPALEPPPPAPPAPPQGPDPQ